jgi:hypothetical protein
VLVCYYITCLISAQASDTDFDMKSYPIIIIIIIISNGNQGGREEGEDLMRDGYME